VSLEAQGTQAEDQLRDYVWRAAHPTLAGQRMLASAVEGQLHLAS
jgi:hypothetical protein